MIQEGTAGYRRGNTPAEETCIRCKYKKRGRYEGEVGCSWFDEYVGENDTCNNFVDIRYTSGNREKLKSMANFLSQMGR